MFKSNGGFTLVELIVVIAILGILSTIAIPAYSKYITSAKVEASEFASEQKAYDESIAAIWDANNPNNTIPKN